jgi:type 1 fimbriae regulatory protein FimB
VYLGLVLLARARLGDRSAKPTGDAHTRQAVNYIVRLVGVEAKLGRVWPHMLRHSCGYYLANQGTDMRTMQDYLGHRDPKHTAHYTRVAGHRFEGLWK